MCFWLRRRIGWKFYLCFIIPGILSAIGIWLFFPDTWGLPLEEVAAIFGVSLTYSAVFDLSFFSLPLLSPTLKFNWLRPCTGRK